MLSNEDIGRFFTAAQVDIPGNRSLREPQREGHASATKYFADGGHRAVEQIPVGCGKTGLISIYTSVVHRLPLPDRTIRP